MILVTIILFLFLFNARAALIVALTIPFSLLFASIWLGSDEGPGQPSVAGRAGFRNGGGWRGGDGREHRAAHEPPREQASSTKPSTRDHPRAAHEVQRPVFYAIAIIITAYLPIFTLQRLKGRLFRPMAWTVAFALLGAMTFSILIAPVLASALFRKGVRERRNPVMAFLTERYRRRLRWAIEHRWLTVGVGVVALWRIGVSGLQRNHRLGVPAAPGRGLDLGSRHAGAEHQPHGRHALHEPGAPGFRVVPGGDKVVSEIGRPDDGTDTGGFGNTEYFVDLKPKAQWRPVFQEDKEELIAAMNREISKLPGRRLELLAAH